MQDGKETTVVADVVRCLGFKQLVTIETCKNNCNFFGGIHKEPVSGRNKDGNTEILKHDLYIICNKPRLIPFETVGEVKKEG